MKIKEWVKEISSVEENGNTGKIRLTRDYIACGFTSFEPKEYMDMIKVYKNRIKIIQIAYKKWQEEFGNKK